jgi:hypothetical protein
MVGVDSQRRKVSPNSDKAVQILGMAMGHIGFNSAANEETQRKSLRVFEGKKKSCSSSPKSDNKSTRKVDWNIEFYSSSKPAREPGLSEVKSFKSKSGSQERLERKSPNDKGSDIRIDQMVGLIKEEQTSRNNETKAISSNNNNGCGPYGMGGNSYYSQTINNTFSSPILTSFDKFGSPILTSLDILNEQLLFKLKHESQLSKAETREFQNRALQQQLKISNLLGKISIKGEKNQQQLLSIKTNNPTWTLESLHG